MNSGILPIADAVFLIQGGYKGKEVHIESKDHYPKSFNDTGVIKNVHLFCFLHDVRSIKNMKWLYHNFVLTNQYGAKLYGHCLRFPGHILSNSEPDSESVYALCLLSQLCLFNTMHHYLVHLLTMKKGITYEKDNISNTDDSWWNVELFRLIHCSLCPVNVGTLVRLKVHGTFPLARRFKSIPSVIYRKNEEGETISYLFGRPPLNGSRFPPVDFKLSILFSCLSIPNVIEVFGNILCESKIVLISSNSAVLAYISQALLTILWPFTWEHAFIPVLPLNMLDFLNAPIPFIMGTLRSERPLELEDDVVVVDLDKNMVNSNKAKTFALPTVIVQNLEEDLSKFATPYMAEFSDAVPSQELETDDDLQYYCSHSNNTYNTEVQTAFFAVWQRLFSGWNFGDDITKINEYIEVWVPQQHRAFYRLFCTTQSFDQFHRTYFTPPEKEEKDTPCSKIHTKHHRTSSTGVSPLRDNSLVHSSPTIDVSPYKYDSISKVSYDSMPIIPSLCLSTPPATPNRITKVGSLRSPMDKPPLPPFTDIKRRKSKTHSGSDDSLRRERTSSLSLSPSPKDISTPEKPKICIPLITSTTQTDGLENYFYKPSILIDVPMLDNEIALSLTRSSTNNETKFFTNPDSQTLDSTYIYMLRIYSEQEDNMTIRLNNLTTKAIVNEISMKVSLKFLLAHFRMKLNQYREIFDDFKYIYSQERTHPIFSNSDFFQSIFKKIKAHHPKEHVKIWEELEKTGYEFASDHLRTFIDMITMEEQMQNQKLQAEEERHYRERQRVDQFIQFVTQYQSEEKQRRSKMRALGFAENISPPKTKNKSTKVIDRQAFIEWSLSSGLINSRSVAEKLFNALGPKGDQLDYRKLMKLIRSLERTHTQLSECTKKLKSITELEDSDEDGKTKETVLLHQPGVFYNNIRGHLYLTTHSIVFHPQKFKEVVKISLSDILEVEKYNFKVIIPPVVQCLKFKSKSGKEEVFSVTTRRSLWYFCAKEVLVAHRIYRDLNDESFLTEAAITVILAQSVASETSKYQYEVLADNTKTSHLTYINALAENYILNEFTSQKCTFKEKKSPCHIATELITTALQILFSYTSNIVTEDNQSVTNKSPIDFVKLRASEEFANFKSSVSELQIVDTTNLNDQEKTVFFVNIYNLLVIHGYFEYGFPSSVLEWRYFSKSVKYRIGFYDFSLNAIHRILRGREAKGNCIGDCVFEEQDPRTKLMVEKKDPRVHFLLSLHNNSSPPIRIVSPPETLERHLLDASAEYCEKHVNINGSKVVLPIIFDWYQDDFMTKEAGSSFLSHLDWLSNEQKKKIAELLENNERCDITYEYDWTPNPKPPI